METVVGRPDRRETSVEDTVLNGDGCKLVQYTHDSGKIARMWICPEKDYSLLKCQTEDPQKHSLSTVVCRVARHESAGKWFPESLIFTKSRKGKVIREEHATITVLSLNEPLPKNTFYLTGIGIPTGQRIHRPSTWSDTGQVEIWDGKKIVVDQPNMAAKPPMIPVCEHRLSDESH